MSTITASQIISRMPIERQARIQKRAQKLKAQVRGMNPKDRFGAKKVSLSKFPAVALAHGAHAMMDGAQKYGAYNWRDNAVIASIYIDACKRHLDAWFDAGEQCAPDSDVHHLGHALACIAIILDAEATGNLIDDRPKRGMITAVYTQIAATIERRNKEEK